MSTTPRTTGPDGNYRDITILLIEDNPADVRLIREMLSETDYATAQFHSFTSLRDAQRAHLVHSSVATILLDLNLPDSEGIDTLLGIKNTYSDSAIIVLTGLDDEAMAIKALRAGAQNYLTKAEISPSMLGRTLRHSIERHTFVQRLREADRLMIERDQRFRKLVEHSTNMTGLLARGGKAIYASPAVERMLGYDHRTKDNALEIVHPDDRLFAQRAFRRIMNMPGRPWPMTIRCLGKNGQVVWIEGTINNLLDTPGVAGIVVNFQEITERIAFEQQVAFDKGNLSALINSTRDLVWSVDRDLRLITANDAFLTIMEQAMGVRLHPGDSLILPDVRGASPTEHWKALYERALDGGSFTLEEHMTNPAEAYNAISFSPIYNGGSVVGVAVFSRNITEIRKAQQALERSYLEVRTSELQKTSILDALPANIALLDGNGDIVAVNEQWRAFASANGYKGSEHGVGSNYPEVARCATGMDAEMGAMAARGIDLVSTGAKTGFSMEYPCDSPAEKRWFRMQVSPLSAKGGQGSVVMHMDITDRKAAEARIQQLNMELEDRVLERTKDLTVANESLGSEMVKNRGLSELLAIRNEDLMSSMTYARGIQNALFPSKESLPFFKATACLAKPRDVVSGDFLWHHETPDHLFVTVADCTGHGVPGALLSMLGNTLLSQVVVDRGIHQPAAALSAIDQAMAQRFARRATEEPMHDGMDIGFLSLEKKTLQLTFAGALIRGLILREGEMMRLECSRHAIGGHVLHSEKQFSDTRFQLFPGDRIVLSTDGYQSQFGGPYGRKMKAQQFRGLLRSTAPLEAAVAIQVLDQEFTRWKGQEEQMDDVLVLLMDV